MSSVSDLVELDVRELAAVLPRRLPDPSSLAADEWLALVSALASKILEAARRLEPDDWATVSRAELHALATAEAAGGISHLDHVIRRINLTSALLAQVTPDEQVAIRDPRAAMDLLFDTLPISPEEARQLAPSWFELDRSEILRLRIAKNLLTPAWEINKHAPDPRMDAWADVYLHLP